MNPEEVFTFQKDGIECTELTEEEQNGILQTIQGFMQAFLPSLGDDMLNPDKFSDVSDFLPF